MEMKKRFIISGGGTGGHIFPALSIAGEIVRRMPDAQILFVGALGRMEMERVPAAGYAIKGLPVMGFDRQHLLRNVKVAYHLLKSMHMARSIIKDFKPDIAIGVGGYASGPTLKAAQKMGIPTLIQEQNSYAGVTNKQLATDARCICVAYNGMERFFPADRIVMTGNPIRQSLLECNATQQEARRAMGVNPDKRTILIIGGSLGALSINRVISAGLARIGDMADHVQVIWQTGKTNRGTSEEDLIASGVNNVLRTDFISNMDMAYRAADLIVSRAGASSISEIQALGKATILVPSPNVAEDHQTKNAQALVEQNAAIMVRDSETPTQLIDCMLRTVTNDGVLKTLSENVLQMAQRDSAARIVDEVFTIIGS